MVDSVYLTVKYVSFIKSSLLVEVDKKKLKMIEMYVSGNNNKRCIN